METEKPLEWMRFWAAYGDQKKLVEIGTPNGGGGGYHISIDHYYQGWIHQRDGRWEGHFNQLSRITGADIDILGEIVLEALRIA